MLNFHPYYTNDGSVGLFSPDFDDIYHSSTGALTEAYEKFIYPIDIDKLLNRKSIKILDICYGIGYNSKSFLNEIFQRKFLKKIQDAKKNIGEIHTNNISSDQNRRFTLSECNDKIYDDNIIGNITIHAVDNDKILTYLSPFIKTGVKNFKNKNIDFGNNKIERYLNKDKKIKPIKIHNLINFLILTKLCQNCPDFLNDNEISSVLNNKKFRPYFDSKIKGIYEFYRKEQSKSLSTNKFYTFLHNIYYQHISNGYKSKLERYNLQGINFELKNMDAREFIKNNENSYDLIFLDAFTPSKCPCLWSYEFFKELFNHLEDDGILLTYSTSASIRAAMTEAGFKVGYIFNQRENKYTGTIAVKDSALINYKLSQFDIGLLETTAGIIYRDENLNSLNEAIIERRKNEVANSKRISTSQYKKAFRRKNDNL